MGEFMRKTLFLFVLATVFFQSFLDTSNLAMEETCVDVKFEFLTGYGSEECYVGDHFSYNFTLSNSGTTLINATFTVKVYNTAEGVTPTVREYNVFLSPNEATFLYPNYTRKGREEHYVHFFNTPETYSIELSSDIPLTYYRGYASGRYTVEDNKCELSLDVMPSYQKAQNERWDEFLQRSENYMHQVVLFSTR